MQGELTLVNFQFGVREATLTGPPPKDGGEPEKKPAKTLSFRSPQAPGVAIDLVFSVEQYDDFVAKLRKQTSSRLIVPNMFTRNGKIRC